MIVTPPTAQDLVTSQFQLGSTSKEASSKSLQTAAQNAVTQALGEKYYEVTHQLALSGWTAPGGSQPPSTLQQAVNDVENNKATLSGWLPPVSQQLQSFNIPVWFWAILAVVLIVALIGVFV